MLIKKFTYRKSDSFGNFLRANLKTVVCQDNKIRTKI